MIIFKAYGIQSDQEIVELIGYEDYIIDSLSASIEECHRQGIFTQMQVIIFKDLFANKHFENVDFIRVNFLSDHISDQFKSLDSR